MEIFELLRKHLATGGIVISKKSSKNHAINVKNSTILILICMHASLAAPLLNDANGFDEYADILFRCISIGVCGILYAIIVRKTTKLFEFINSLADTVNERIKYSESQTLYIETSQKIEKWVMILDFACTKITPMLVVCPAIIVSFFTYFTTDLGNSSFVLPVPLWFPFDTQNPIGFLVAVFILSIGMFASMVNVKCLAIFAFGTCVMLFPLTKDMKINLEAIKGNARRKKNRFKIASQFTQFVQFHYKLIQLIYDYSDLLKMSFLIALSWSIAGVCFLILLLNMKMSTNNLFEMIAYFIGTFWSFVAIFGVCEFGERLSGTLNEINDEYDQFAWYLFPYKSQRMLTTLLMVAQKPIELRIFGSISCSRITFQNVIKKAYSGFMVLQRFGN